MAFPLVPLVIIGVGLAACAAAVNHDKPNRTLYYLAGSEWGFSDGTDRFVQFREKGELSGYGGCNRFFGSYDLEGTSLTIGPLASTKMACADGMTEEQDFFNVLQDARRIEATHAVLNLFDGNGNKLATLKRRDWD